MTGNNNQCPLLYKRYGDEVQVNYDGGYVIIPPVGNWSKCSDTGNLPGLNVTLSYIPEHYVGYTDSDIIGWSVLSECGDTNTGIGPYGGPDIDEGFGRGFGISKDGAYPLNELYRGLNMKSYDEDTGIYHGWDGTDYVVAQACILDCNYRILAEYTAAQTNVTVAKIGKQWFIVRVGGASPTYWSNRLCGCCGLRSQTLQAVSNCPSYGNQAFDLEKVSLGQYYGSINVSGEFLSVNFSCNPSYSNQDHFSASISCTGSAGPDTDGSPRIDKYGTCSGVAESGELEAGTVLAVLTSNSIECGSCTGMSVTISVKEEDGLAYCKSYTDLGITVKANACNMTLQPDDHVILALIDEKWSVVRACSEELDCGNPCAPQPPEYPGGPCCGIQPEDLPTLVPTLTGVISVSGDCANCNNLNISFEIDYILGGWTQVGTIVCSGLVPEPFPATGYNYVEMTFSGVHIGCDTNTDGSGQFSVNYGSVYCDISDSSSTSSCEPIYMLFNTDISSCCTPGGVSTIISLEVSE